MMKTKLFYIVFHFIVMDYIGMNYFREGRCLLAYTYEGRCLLAYTYEGRCLLAKLLRPFGAMRMSPEGA